MANIKDLIQSIESGDSSFDEKLAAINEMEATLVAMRAQEQSAIDENVALIVEAIRVMERKVEAQLEVAKAIVPEVGPAGPKGEPGERGLDGANGRDGRDGADGRNGVDGQDGVSVTDAKIDFDGSLVITLSTGREINVGEVVAPDLAEKIKVISTMSTNTAIADITGGTINNTVIGNTTPNAATFTTLTATGQTSLGGDTSLPALQVNATSGITRYCVLSGSAAGGVTLQAQASGGNPGFTFIARGSGVHSFSTNGTASTTQFQVSHTASAVNYVQVTGAATTGTVSVRAEGSDSGINLGLSSKGAGAIRFYTDGLTSEQFRVNRTAGTIVNRMAVTGSTTGNAPVFSVDGSDTNIDLALTPKGTGNVRFGTLTASSDVPITGYIEIKDSSGTIRKLAVVA